MNPSSLFSLTDHLEKLSKDGDPLEVLDATVDFEYFRTWLGDSEARQCLCPCRSGYPLARKDKEAL